MERIEDAPDLNLRAARALKGALALNACARGEEHRAFGLALLHRRQHRLQFFLAAVGVVINRHN